MLTHLLLDPLLHRVEIVLAQPLRGAVHAAGERARNAVELPLAHADAAITGRRGELLAALSAQPIGTGIELVGQGRLELTGLLARRRQPFPGLLPRVAELLLRAIDLPLLHAGAARCAAHARGARAGRSQPGARGTVAASRAATARAVAAAAADSRAARRGAR